MYFIVGDILFAPNQFMYSIGGDPLVIYYDVVYYVKYGVNARHNGMNYPYGELIFLTDAQGALAVSLRWIHINIFPISDYVIGIIHMLNILAILACAVITQKILEAFELKKSWAIIFAILITILSPQIIRVTAHFGLAYPFIIPLSFLFFIRKYRLQKIEWRDLIYLFVLVFFTFNNPYVGLSSAFFLMLCSFFVFIMQRPKRKIAIYIFLVAIIMAAIPFFYFHFADGVTDRVKLQWGYFDLGADIRGFLHAPNSLLSLILNKLNIPIKHLGFEKHQNIGLIAIIFLLLFSITLFLKKRLTIPTEFWIILLSAFFIFLYSSASIGIILDEDVIEEKLGFLLMFKAVGRLAWVCYFALTIFAVIIMDRLWKRKWNLYLKNGLFALVVVIWAIEFNTYIVIGKYRRQPLYDNIFTAKKQQETIEQLNANNIDLANYQSSLWIPRVQTWTDIFSCEPNFFAHFYGMKLSASTGLPSISSMLSRISIGQTAEATELLASPLVHKSLVDKLPNKKNLLLVVGSSETPYTKGEQFMISQATLLMQEKDYALYRLPLDKINNNKFQQKARTALDISSTPKLPNIHYGFDNQKTAFSYFGQGAKFIEQDKAYVLIDTILPDNFISDKLVLSGWTHFDALKHGLGEYRIKLLKKNGEISEPWIDTRNTNEIHDDWIRWDLEVESEPGMQVQLFFQAGKNTWIDEIDLKNGQKDLLNMKSENSNEFLYNNYKVFLK